MDEKQFIDITVTLIGGLAALILTLGGVIYAVMNRRLDKAEMMKADRDELEALAAEVKDLSADIRDGNKTTNQILVEMARLTQGMARMVSDIESEKRTRADGIRDVLVEVRRARDETIQRMSQMIAYGRRATDPPQDER